MGKGVIAFCLGVITGRLLPWAERAVWITLLAGTYAVGYFLP